MANGTRTYKPWFLSHISVEAWNTMSEGERQRYIAQGQSAKAPDESGKATLPVADPKLRPMKDIREWTESVDDISGERLRNCIIFQLDEKKDKWWRHNLTPAFVRKFAKKLDDETPIGWTLNPLVATKLVNIGDGENAEKKLVRDPVDSEEWLTLHSMLIGVFDKPNPYIVKKLAKKGCPKCGGKGGYNKKAHPEAKSIKKGYEEFYHTPCECCHRNPFDNSYVVRCECGRDIRVPSDYLKEKLFCEKCKTLHDNPHRA